MPPFNAETARLAGIKGVAAKKAHKELMAYTPIPPANGYETALDRDSRLWGIIAAIDKRMSHEIARTHPDGALLRDLATARRTLLAQADGPEPVKEQPGKVAAPVLAEPEPVQE